MTHRLSSRELQETNTFYHSYCKHHLARDTRYLQHYWNPAPGAMPISIGHKTYTFQIMQCDFCKSQVHKIACDNPYSYARDVWYEPINIVQI